MKGRKFWLVIVPLLFFCLILPVSLVQAKLETHTLRLGKAHGGHPYTLIFPIPISREGTIRIHATFPNVQNNHPSAILIRIPKSARKGRIIAKARLDRRNMIRLSYDVDSYELNNYKFELDLLNFSMKRRVIGNVTIGYPVEGESHIHQHPPLDLMIKDVRLNNNCQIEVVVMNRGPNRLSPIFWSGKAVTLKEYVNGNFWGSAEGLKAIDPGKLLKEPGGMAIYRSLHRVNGTETIRVEMVLNAPINDQNPMNNTKEVRLTCAAGKPDLVIDSISLDHECRVLVKVRNVGGPLDHALWTMKNAPMLYIYQNGRPWGGAAISAIDPQKNLSMTNGTATYRSHLKVPTTLKIRAMIDSNSRIDEKNEMNNFMETTLKCQQNIPIRPFKSIGR